MNALIIRTYFYTLSGIISALTGWSVSQIIWQELGGILTYFIPFISRDIYIPPYMILLLIVTPCIATGMVIAQVFLSNPRHYKANWRFLSRLPLKQLFFLGFILGIILICFSWLLLQSNFSGGLVRIFSWVIIGAFAGLSESITWKIHSISGTSDKSNTRVIQSVVFGTIAGFIAATLSEYINIQPRQYQEPFAFFSFGSLLGIALSLASRPGYQVALRAGAGFEAKEKSKIEKVEMFKPSLRNQSLKYVPDNEYECIEEGISIQLPTKTDKPLIIGSGEHADIYIPYLPKKCASLKVHFGEVIIRCLVKDTVCIQQKLLSENQTATLKHNQIITFYHQDNEEKFYRFIFYNRILDPQS